MRFNKMISLGGFSVLVGLCTVSGCNDMDGVDPAAEGEISSVDMAFTGGVFDGNSVRIVATRNGEADSKYPCVSEASGCFNFLAGSNGVPTPSLLYPGDAKDFQRLCPTKNVNKHGDPGDGTYDITYEIFNGPDCESGAYNEVITGKNFDCFDIGDVVEQAYPNMTNDEELKKGLNTNTLLCLSKNSQKEFEFYACEVLPDPPYGKAAYDCNCYQDPYGMCACPFDPAPLLYDGCTFDPYKCDIICPDYP